MANQEKRVQAHERDKQALELRKAGVSYADIAARLGWRGPSGAHAAVKRALVRTLQEPADELRKLEEARLDAMLLAVWPKVVKGNYGAIDRALRILERRAKLLGLNAPAKQDITSAGEKIIVHLSFDGDED